jgi:DNA-binding MarR family transcriptional regulator
MKKQLASGFRFKANFCYYLYKSAMRMRESLDKSLAKLGIIAPQLGILSVLNEHGDMSQADICKFIAADRATMVKLIDGLEGLKFVARKAKAGDRRVNQIAITPKGITALGKARAIAKLTEEALLAPLTPEETKALKEIIPKLLP